MEKTKENNNKENDNISFNDYMAKMELTANKEDYYEFMKVKKTMDSMRVAIKDLLENRKNALKNYNDFRAKSRTWHDKYVLLNNEYNKMKDEWFFYISDVKVEDEK